MLRKIEGKRRRRQQRMRWLDGITDSNGHEFEQTPGDSSGQWSLVRCSPWAGSQRVGPDWVTEQQACWFPPHLPLSVLLLEVSGPPTLPHHYFPRPLYWGTGNRTVVFPPNRTPWMTNGACWQWGAKPGVPWWLKGVVAESMSPVRWLGMWTHGVKWGGFSLW